MLHSNAAKDLRRSDVSDIVSNGVDDFAIDENL